MRDDDVVCFGPFKGLTAKKVVETEPEYVETMKRAPRPKAPCALDSFARYCRRQRGKAGRRRVEIQQPLLKTRRRQGRWLDPNFDSDDEDLDADAVCPRCRRLGPCKRTIYYDGGCEYCTEKLLRDSHYKLGCPCCRKIVSKRHEKALRASGMCLKCATDEFMHAMF